MNLMPESGLVVPDVVPEVIPELVTEITKLIDTFIYDIQKYNLKNLSAEKIREIFCLNDEDLKILKTQVNIENLDSYKQIFFNYAYAIFSLYELKNVSISEELNSADKQHARILSCWNNFVSSALRKRNVDISLALDKITTCPNDQPLGGFFSLDSADSIRERMINTINNLSEHIIIGCESDDIVLKTHFADTFLSSSEFTIGGGGVNFSSLNFELDSKPVIIDNDSIGQLFSINKKFKIFNIHLDSDGMKKPKVTNNNFDILENILNKHYDIVAGDINIPIGLEQSNIFNLEKILQLSEKYNYISILSKNCYEKLRGGINQQSAKEKNIRNESMIAFVKSLDEVEDDTVILNSNILDKIRNKTIQTIALKALSHELPFDHNILKFKTENKKFSVINLGSTYDELYGYKNTLKSEDIMNAIAIHRCLKKIFVKNFS